MEIEIFVFLFTPRKYFKHFKVLNAAWSQCGNRSSLTWFVCGFVGLVSVVGCQLNVLGVTLKDVGLGKHFDHAVGFVNHYTQRDKPIA